MRKKLSILCAVMFVFGLMAGSVSAIEYCFDFLESGNPGGPTTGLKTCDTVNPEAVSPGGTFAIDIWAIEVPESIISGGFQIEYNPSQVSLVSVEAYDGVDLAGPWDGSATFKIPDLPVTDPNYIGYILGLVQLSCAVPDAGGDVIYGKATFECLAAGNAEIRVRPIPDFDTTVGCNSGVNYDTQIGSQNITVNQVETCQSDADCNDGISCTTDVCDLQTNLCSNTPDNAVCDDQVGCTTDVCDPVNDCQNTPDDAACDDGLFCTGVETCDPVNDCQADAAFTCDDGIACTDDSCDEDADTCVNAPNDANCPEDGVFCNGVEFCDVNTDCTSPGNPCSGDTPVCVEPPGECRAPACSITLDPPTSTVETLDTVQFTVLVEGTCDNEPSYTWGISTTGCTGEATGSTIGSTIDATGLYTAGNSAGIDTVRVKDVNNGDICATADVTVEVPVTTSTTTIRPPTTTTSTPVSTTTSTVDVTTTTTTPGSTTTTTVQPSATISLRPERWLQSRWVPVPLFLNINGTNTNFERRVSVVSFQPANAVFYLLPIVWNNERISMLVYVVPRWLSGPLDTVEVTVTTGAEVVSADLEINLLPFFLEEGVGKAK